MKVSLSISKPQGLALLYPNPDSLIKVLKDLQSDLDKTFKGEVAIFLDEETSKLSISGIAYAEDLGYTNLSNEIVNNILDRILKKHLEYEYLDIYPRYKLEKYDIDNVKISEQTEFDTLFH